MCSLIRWGEFLKNSKKVAPNFPWTKVPQTFPRDLFIVKEARFRLEDVQFHFKSVQFDWKMSNLFLKVWRENAINGSSTYNGLRLLVIWLWWVLYVEQLVTKRRRTTLRRIPLHLDGLRAKCSCHQVVNSAGYGFWIRLFSFGVETAPRRESLTFLLRGNLHVVAHFAHSCFILSRNS